MDAVIKTLEDRGHRVEMIDDRHRRQTCAVIEGERDCVLPSRESQRLPHEPTKEELADKIKWGHSGGPKYDHAPTGSLCLEVEGWSAYPGIRKRRGDSTTRMLENQVGNSS